MNSIQISMAPPEDPLIRRASRVLAVIHELHKVGCQRIRIAPGVSPSGCHWRCAITHAANVKSNGWEPLDWSTGVVTYTTGDEDRYFGWADGVGKSARELAQMFVDRFPDLCRLGRGADPIYAGWYVQMLGAAESGRLPIFYADYELEHDAVGPPPHLRS